ncbi:MAG: peptidase MA family metallohydrolase [Persicimonas sp.]
MGLIGVLLVLVAGAPASAKIPADRIATTEAADGALVFHHLKRYEPAIDVLSQEGPPVLRRVESTLGLDNMPPIDVWVLPKVSDYFEFHEIDGGAPKWAVGLSFSAQHRIIVAHGGQRAPNEVMQTFSHELAHVAVDHARDRGGSSAPVPRWFNEGFSVMVADQWTPERSERLSQAASGGGLKSFDELWDRFPAHHMSASLAYDQSFHFVRWLESEHGDDLWARVTQRIREGQSFRDALEAETGSSFAALEAYWRDSLSSSSSFWSILRDDFTIFFGAAVLFIIAFLVARRRRKRQFESMEDEDADDLGYDASRYPLPGQEQPE